MSQRGGSVASDVRFGAKVYSPMVPPGEADFLVVLAPDQVEREPSSLRPGGVLIVPDAVDESTLPNKEPERSAAGRAQPPAADIPEERLARGDPGQPRPQSCTTRNVQGIPRHEGASE